MRERMMERSEARIGAIADHEGNHAARAASRVMETTQSWQDWSGSHIRLLEAIATQRRSEAQARSVRRMALSMIHRKAPFEGLRDLRIQGAERARFFESFYGSGNVARTLLLEHRSFIRSMCSYSCVEELCGMGTLLRIRAYERLYERYWQARLASLPDRAVVRQEPADALRAGQLREQLRIARMLLLERPSGPDDEQTLADLRRPNGDTVRMRVLPVQSG